tara:strand:+ start:63 stop:776 length:714 start_codon:yes stop_codon:yes gene_type:complete
MKNLKIGVFAYNWPHHKTQMGLTNLYFKNIVPDCVFLANPVELKFYKSKVRVAPRDLYLHNSEDICKSFNFPSTVIKHNSIECENLIREKKLDLGIILGARILKKNIVNAFNIGIINMHPGLLPENRGLDNLKWAIIKLQKQGVTTHLIDKNIDRGRLIDRQEISVYKDDSLVDIHLRIQAKEQKMMIEAIEKIEKSKSAEDLKYLSNGGHYNRSVPPDVEKDLEKYFLEYKEKFGE